MNMPQDEQPEHEVNKEELDLDEITIHSIGERRILKPWDAGSMGSDTGTHSIEGLDLKVRTYNCLKRGGIRSVEQLHALRCREVLAFPHFGAEEIDDLQEKLQLAGLAPLEP
jgi:DNA-directed RNA polymerase alpha subunit